MKGGETVSEFDQKGDYSRNITKKKKKFTELGKNLPESHKNMVEIKGRIEERIAKMKEKKRGENN